MKRILMLCLAMMLMFTACTAAPSPADEPAAAAPTKISEPTPSPEVKGLTGDIGEEDLREVQLAAEFGLLPDTLAGAYNAPISLANMEALTKNAVAGFYGMTIEPDLSALTTDEDAPSVTRLEAAVILTEATRAAWGEYPWPNGDPKKPAEQMDRICADDYAVWDAAPSSPAIIRLWNNTELPLAAVSTIFATRQVDKTTGIPLIPLDTNWNFNPDEPMSQLAAIQAAVRLYRSFDPKPEYVSLADVPAHTIAKELYSGDSPLPEASNQKLPAWRGVLHMPKCWAIAEAFGTYNDANYRESDFKAMRDAGLNMAAIYISPTRLGFPYGDEDVGKVNLAELELLDQALTWAFENGIHIQLAFNGVPGAGRHDFAEANDHSRLFTDEETAQLFTDCWRMIARRYADIPNKYLGFNLFNEIDPPSDEEYIRVFGPAIDAIWEESPGRVIIADIHSEKITGESMAKKGVALSRHLYPLPLLDYSLSGEDGGGLMDLYPGFEQELTWPQVYLPSMLHGTGNRITLKGSFKAGELTIGVNQVADGNEVLCVRINGVEALAEPVTATEERNVWNMRKVDKEYTVTIPDGAMEIEFYNKAKNGILVYNRLKITQSGKDDIILYPHDTFNINWEPESATIQIDADGSLNGSRFITWDDLKSMGGNSSYNSIRAMAEEYNVGFVVGEFGPFGQNGLPQDVLEGYLSMMIEGMLSDGVGWAHAGTVGRTNLLYTRPDELPRWTFEPLEDSPYYVNTFIRDVFRKYSGAN